jgi:hypothetical protein
MTKTLDLSVHARFCDSGGRGFGGNGGPSAPACANDRRFWVRERHSVEQALLNRSERERKLLIAHLASANGRLLNLTPFGMTSTKCLKPQGEMVGVRGFEPPTPASRICPFV